MKKATLCYIIKNGKILLIKKKRGLGAGKYNGPGGKVEDGEDVFDSITREVEEELGIIPLNLELVGKIVFYWDDGEHDQTVFVFVSDNFEGKLISTDEAEPEWFPIDNIPFDKMWDDDKFWMPLMLKGRKFSGVFRFSSDHKLKDYILEETNVIEL